MSGTPDEQRGHERISLVQPYSYNASSCGYCKSQKRGSRSYGIVAHQLSARIYQQMIDQGWRRSGTYCYRPDNSSHCCPHHTIRCGARDFKASKSQRQLLNRFLRRIKDSGPLRDAVPGSSQHEPDGQMGSFPEIGAEPLDLPSYSKAENVSLHGLRSTGSSSRNKGKGKDSAPYNLLDTFGEIESPAVPLSHRFTIRTEPASFSKQKYDLFTMYQARVHNDHRTSERGFQRFLCDTPLQQQQAGPGVAFGSFHQLYYLDDELVAIGVIDILPHSVSSVYFIWHPDYSNLSLGKVGALREIALTQLLSRQLPELQYYYLGYYIHSCPKMRYKADYRPAELADSADHTFHSFEHCGPLLDQSLRALFSRKSIAQFGSSMDASSKIESDGAVMNGEEEDVDTEFPIPPPPGWLDPLGLPRRLLSSAMVWDNRQIVPLIRSSFAQQRESMRTACEGLAALGEDLGKQIVLVIA